MWVTQSDPEICISTPDELGRVRASIERMGILNPVLVATAVEATRGFPARSAGSRPVASIWPDSDAHIPPNCPWHGACMRESGQPLDENAFALESVGGTATADGR